MPGVDNLETCAQICESHGFARPAAMLRARSDRTIRVYLVIERHHTYSDEYGYWLSDKEGLPRAVFLSRAEAESSADSRNIEAFRTVRPFNSCDFTADSPWPTVAEIEEKVGKILGAPFRLPGEPGERSNIKEHATIFPEWATDDQMLRITRLFDRPFFYVGEADVASSSLEPMKPRVRT
jgi:hypothetical protein